MIELEIPLSAYSISLTKCWFELDCYLPFVCSDASISYPGGPYLFKNLNFGKDIDSWIASKYKNSNFGILCLRIQILE